MITVYLQSKNYSAKGEYDEGKIIVKKGSKVNKDLSTNFAYSKIVKKYRDDNTVVSKSGNVLKDVEFSSPSTAAQFVLGYSSNGWKSWKIDKHVYLESVKEGKNNG